MGWGRGENGGRCSRLLLFFSLLVVVFSFYGKIDVHLSAAIESHPSAVGMRDEKEGTAQNRPQVTKEKKKRPFFFAPISLSLSRTLLLGFGGPPAHRCGWPSWTTRNVEMATGGNGLTGSGGWPWLPAGWARAPIRRDKYGTERGRNNQRRESSRRRWVVVRDWSAGRGQTKEPQVVRLAGWAPRRSLATRRRRWLVFQDSGPRDVTVAARLPLVGAAVLNGARVTSQSEPPRHWSESGAPSGVPCDVRRAPAGGPTPPTAPSPIGRPLRR